jgi:hypothetical protein
MKGLAPASRPKSILDLGRTSLASQAKRKDVHCRRVEGSDFLDDGILPDSRHRQIRGESALQALIPPDSRIAFNPG